MKDALSDVFAALADLTRRRIYEQLLTISQGRTATELCESASISRQAIVQHLQILVRSGLASSKRDGKEVRYFVTSEGTSDATQWMINRSNEWDRRIATLEKTVRTGAKKQ